MKQLIFSFRLHSFLAAGLFLMATVVLLFPDSTFGQANSDPWVIVTSGGNGPLNAHTTHADLVRTFGAASVAEQDGIEGFSGDMQYVTVLFPKDSQRSIEILWRDAEKKTIPQTMTIRGNKSRWNAPHGISLGISLKQLESLNGKPFKLIGFGIDNSGTITSWENGSLAIDLDGGHGQVVIRLDAAPRKGVSEKELKQVRGAGDFLSQHPVMQKVNPRAYQVVWEFPLWEQK